VAGAENIKLIPSVTKHPGWRWRPVMVDLKRDPKGSMAYWNTWTEFSQSTIEAMWRQVRDGIENEAYKPQFLFDITRRHADLMLYRYSRGDAVHSLTSSFEGLLDAWEASS